MKLTIAIGGYARDDIKAQADFVVAAEKLGVDCVWSAEAWGQDAITSLAYMAALTEKIHLGTGIMQISARAPSMTAMTALSMHNLSNGRFRLGLGASGPQVVEGLHGAAYKAPLSRLKEHVEICRMAFAGEKLRYDGAFHRLPRPGGEGKAIRLDHEPADIPIYLATLGPKSLEYTGAAADGWLGTSFSPEHADAHLDHIKAGAEAAGRSVSDININVALAVAIGDNVEEIIEARRGGVAFQMGGMGSAQTNFYNDAFKRAGYEDDARAIQSLWIEGKRKEAAERVPDSMITEFQAVGTRQMVLERIKKHQDVGVDSLTLRLDGKTVADRLTLLEQVSDIVKGLD